MAQLSPCYNSLLNRDTQQEEWRDFPLLNSEEMDLDCRRVHVKLSERLGVSSAEPISLCTWMDKDEDAEQRKSNSLQAFTSLMRRPQPPPPKKKKINSARQTQRFFQQVGSQKMHSYKEKL